MKKIILIGGGGHSKVIIDIIRSTNEFEIVGVTEKNTELKYILDIPILGDDSILEELFIKGVEYAFVCVGISEDSNLRNLLYNKAKEIGFKIPTLIHRQAVVSSYAKVGEGTCVMAGAIINPHAKIGNNSVINTGAIIEHDCIVGDNTFISPGALLAGSVTIKNNSLIGIGSKIIEGKVIGNNVVIGAGAVVIDNIPDNCIAVGVPAKVIKEKVRNNESKR